MIMCLKGWIGFDIACAMVLGSNIGTTITPIIASLGANDAAKKPLSDTCYSTASAYFGLLS